MEVREMHVKDFGKALKIRSSHVELILALEFGIRILKFSHIDEENIFYVNPTLELPVSGSNQKCKLYGGHRIWTSPESDPRTYWPEDKAVTVEISDQKVNVVAPTDAWSRIQKSLTLEFIDEGKAVKLTGSVTNKCLWPLTFSTWTIKMMKENGLDIVPFSYRQDALEPYVRLISAWPYTNMRDERVFWGDKFITLRQKAGAGTSFKLGVNNRHGWSSYVADKKMFVLESPFCSGEQYPDGDVSYEVFTNALFLEKECLSPLRTVQPEQNNTIVEIWRLFDNAEIRNPADEAEIEAVINAHYRCLF